MPETYHFSESGRNEITSSHGQLHTNDRKFLDYHKRQRALFRELALYLLLPSSAHRMLLPLRFRYADVTERSITIIGKNAPIGVAGLINPGA